MTYARSLLASLLFVALLAAPARAETDAGVCLEAVGGTTAGYVYSMYMFIGVTADAFTKQAYDAKQVEQLMTVGVKMLAESRKQLDKVKRAGLSKVDRAAVTEFQAILGLLREQSKALITYAGSGLGKDAEQYEKTRQRAWKRIAKLLGFEENKPPT